MSQFHPPADQHDFNTTDQPASDGSSNPLGIAGFVLSLLCVTAPIGLIVSIIALFKQPRGFAIAGTVIGLILTSILGFFTVAAIKMWPEIKNVLEAQSDFVAIKGAIITHQNANDGQLPPDLSVLSLSSDILTDPWGTQWGYELSSDGTTFTLVSAGPDGVMNSSDDARLPESTSEQEAYEIIGEAIEAHYKNRP